MTDERIVYLPETDSTNSEIRRRLVECPDMRGGTVVAADFLFLSLRCWAVIFPMFRSNGPMIFITATVN